MQPVPVGPRAEASQSIFLLSLYRYMTAFVPIWKYCCLTSFFKISISQCHIIYSWLQVFLLHWADQCKPTFQYATTQYCTEENCKYQATEYYWPGQPIWLLQCMTQKVRVMNDGSQNICCVRAPFKDWELSLVTTSCGSEFHSLMADGRKKWKYTCRWILANGWARDLPVTDLFLREYSHELALVVGGDS